MNDSEQILSLLKDMNSKISGMDTKISSMDEKISIMDDSQEKYSLPLQKNEYLRQEYPNRQIHDFFLPLNNFSPFYQFLI